eukprot:1161148-Pelagomonas_calceolata.AAC.5
MVQAVGSTKKQAKCPWTSMDRFLPLLQQTRSLEHSGMGKDETQQVRTGLTVDVPWVWKRRRTLAMPAAEERCQVQQGSGVPNDLGQNQREDIMIRSSSTHHIIQLQSTDTAALGKKVKVYAVLAR